MRIIPTALVIIVLLALPGNSPAGASDARGGQAVAVSWLGARGEEPELEVAPPARGGRALPVSRWSASGEASTRNAPPPEGRGGSSQIPSNGAAG